MYWRVWLVDDDQLSNDWVLVELGPGDFVSIARRGVSEREPGRITTEVMEELARLKCPDDPPPPPDGQAPTHPTTVPTQPKPAERLPTLTGAAAKNHLNSWGIAV